MKKDIKFVNISQVMELRIIYIMSPIVGHTSFYFCQLLIINYVE